ncbi:MAG: hypothetical protein AB4911_10720 [Oscillochloridaceae bacterium umkhey_bin13]
MRQSRLGLLLLSLILLLGLVMTSVAAQIPAAPQQLQTTYLPIVRLAGQPSIFGVETTLGQLSNAVVRQRAAELGIAWVRINGVAWHVVQPNEGVAPDWTVDTIVRLERDLEAAAALGIEPTVIIRGAPEWAAIIPTARCSAIRDDRLAAYAVFLEELAARYRDRVTYWELGNEPDVDPTLINGNWPFGCLGNIADPYYGGGRYGEMLQVASAALRRGNPQAKIVFGGLLLDRPETTDPLLGNPERFLEGALIAGAANALDVVAFHSYPSYSSSRFEDQDFMAISPWTPRGGFTVGKINFVREVMSRYGVSKPVWINEMGLISCDTTNPLCTVPLAEFEQVQAEHVVRVMSRAAANGVQMLAWYTLNNSGWRNSSLLGANQTPKPVYFSYQHMIRTVSPYLSVRTVDYGPNIEAYRFDQGNQVVDVLWSRTATPTKVRVPLNRNPQTSTLNGTGSVPGRTDGFDAIITVGFTPIYITRLP